MIAVHLNRTLQIFGRSAVESLKTNNLLPTSSFLCSILTNRMASSADLQRIKARSEETDRILAELQGQIEAVRKAAVREAGRGEEEQLVKENEAIRREVLALKKALALAEIGNGVRQVKMPTKGDLSSLSASTASAPPVVNGSSAPAPEKKQQAKSENAGKKSKPEQKPDAGGKKAKTEKGGKGGKGGAGGEEGKAKKAGAASGGDNADAAVDISRLDLRVGKIVDVEKHPDADSLYVEQVDLGEGKTRTVVSGLVKHVPINAMRERIAVFMCNLKPAKMRGVLSEGMIMCAVGPEKTEILVPPTDSVIGDRVKVLEFPGTPDGQLNPKKKIWETLKPDVRTNASRVATYKGAPLIIEGKGQVVAPTLADCQIS